MVKLRIKHIGLMMKNGRNPESKGKMKPKRTTRHRDEWWQKYRENEMLARKAQKAQKAQESIESQRKLPKILQTLEKKRNGTILGIKKN